MSNSCLVKSKLILRVVVLSRFKCQDSWKLNIFSTSVGSIVDISAISYVFSRDDISNIAWSSSSLEIKPRFRAEWLFHVTLVKHCFDHVTWKWASPTFPTSTTRRGKSVLLSRLWRSSCKSQFQEFQISKFMGHSLPIHFCWTVEFVASDCFRHQVQRDWIVWIWRWCV